MSDADKFSDFVDGQADCREGKPADPDRSDAYQRGYSVQYELEQVMTHNSLRRAG